MIRATRIPVFLLLLFLLLILFGIGHIILDYFWRKRHTSGLIPSKSKIAGTALGLCSAAIISLAIWFLPGINITAEAKRADLVIEFSNKLSKDSVDYPSLVEQTDQLMNAFFDTELIAGDEAAKLELLNRAVKNACTRSKDPIYHELSEDINIESRAQLSSDLTNLVALTRFAQDHKLIEIISSGFADGGFEQLSDLENKSDFCDMIYSLSFSEGIVRLIMTEGIRSVSDDSQYQYPDYIDTINAKEDFLVILNSLPSIASLMGSNNFSDLTKDQRKAIMSDMDQLRQSSLLPSEVFAKLLSVMR
jgi:hypothetical protein